MGWYNSDGLYVKFGTEEATPGKAGAYRTAGPQQMIELFIDDMTDLTATAVIQDYNVVVPKNARIEKVEVITQTAVTDAGGTSVLNIGLKRTDNSTELDYNGLVAALPLASFNAAGETYEAVIGATYVGALVGTTLAYNGYLTADYDTEAFTAGAIRVRIYFVRNLA